MHCFRRFWWLENGVPAALIVLAVGSGLLRGDEPTEDKIADDTCILNLTLPEGATVTCGDKDLGTQRRLSWKGLPTGEYRRTSLAVHFPDGQSDQRTLLVAGGRHLQLSLNEPNRARPQLALQTGHSGQVRAVAFSPDGRLLATGGDDYAVRIWDVVTGHELRCIRGHTGPTEYLAFCLDGKNLLSFSHVADGRAIVWDPFSGKELRHFAGGGVFDRVSAGTVFATALVHPDGKRLITSHQERGVQVWDLATGGELQRIPSLKVSRALAVSPDGRTLACSIEYPNLGVELWDLRSGKRLRLLSGDRVLAQEKSRGPAAKSPAAIQLPNGGVFSVVLGAGFSPDGKSLAACIQSQNLNDRTGGRNVYGAVISWDVRSGNVLWNIDIGRVIPNANTALAWSHNGRKIAVAGNGVVLFESASGKQQTLVDPISDESRLNDQHLSPAVSGAAFSPDDRLLATGGLQPAILDATSGKRVIALLQQEVAMPAFSPGGHYLAMGLEAIDIWDLAQGKKVGQIQTADDGIFRLAWSHDARYLVAGTRRKVDPNGKHSPTTTKPMSQWDNKYGSQRGRSASVEEYFEESYLTVWEVATKRQVLRRLWSTHDHVTGLDFSANDQELVTYESVVNTIRWWNLDDGKLTRTVVVPRDSSAQGELCSPLIAFANGSRLIVSTTAPLPEGHRLRVLDAGSGKSISSIPLADYGSTRASLSENGKCLLVSSGDWTTKVQLISLSSGGTLRQLVSPLSKMVCAMEFTHEDQWALTADYLGHVELWDLATGQQLLQYTLPSDGDEALVTTSEGFFDGPRAAREKVIYRVGDGLTVVPVDRFFQDFYYPGLLQSVWQGAQPLSELQLGQSLPPRIRILDPARPGTTSEPVITIRVDATDQGGGIRGPWLVHNGARVLNRSITERHDQTLVCQFEVPLVEGDNQLEARGSSADGSWESDPATLTMQCTGSLARPELHLVTVSNELYGQSSLHSPFAGRDASAMAELFQQRRGVLYNQVHLYSVANQEATREGILQQLRHVADVARPQDMLVVFLRGAATTVDRQYYYLPYEFHSDGAGSAEDVIRQGLRATDLGDAIAAVSALKRIVIFDTQQAFPQRLLTRDPFAFRGALERLSRAEGAFTIASISDQPTTSGAELGHGILTYTLLAGVRAVQAGPLQDTYLHPADQAQTAHVLEWIGFATTHSTALGQKYALTDQDVQYGIAGFSFPVLPLPTDSPQAEQQPAAVAESRPEPAAGPQPAAPPTADLQEVSNAVLHVLVVGVSQYAQPGMNLRFAAADAREMGALFQQRCGAGFGSVKVTQLLDAEATRAQLEAALSALAQQVQAEDTVVVFLAGHGTLVGQRYYFVPHDFRHQGELEQDVRDQALAADVLAEFISKVPVKRRVVILDTCASGGALQAALRGNDPYAFRGAFEQLDSGEGTFVLAASAAREAAQELNLLEHGLLTYTLLAGVKGVTQGPLRDLSLQPTDAAGTVDVVQWFSYASGHVSRLTRQLQLPDQDVQVLGRGRSFPLVRVRR